MGLQQIANQYHAHANKIARRRVDKNGQLPARYMRAVEYYRDCAAKVSALILPEDVPVEMTWQLEDEQAALAPASKVTTRDKAATPQELLKKANS